MIKGKIHSFESFGATDGPGIRFVVFMQGCNFRCKYCHNPDTWGKDKGMEVTADAVIEKALRYRAYWGKDGGITVSGGEPLLQIDFLTELFKKAKENDINTTIDTAGEPFTFDEPFISKFDELMKHTDLVMLDIKSINPKTHNLLTGFDGQNVLEMAKYLDKLNIPLWIRHVLVPTVTDFDEDLEKLGEFIKTLNNVQKAEILPYHTMGIYKWEALGYTYPLKDIAPPTEDRIENAKQKISIQ